MRAKSLALLILALGCGLVASIGITQVMAKKDAGDPKEAGETRPVIVTMREIPFGEPLTAEVVKLEQWPKELVPEGAITKIEEIEGRKCKGKLAKGEPILEGRLDADSASELIPAGYRVVSVRVDSVSSGGGLIAAGDRVDLLVHMVRNPSRGIMQTSTRTFLQDVKVFAVNDVFNPESASDEDKSKDVKTVSLLVTPKQAQEVMFAGKLGEIQLVMRNATDDNLDELPEMGLPSLFPEAEKEEVAKDEDRQSLDSFLNSLNNDKQSEPAAGGQQAAVDTISHTMRIMDGSEIYDVQLNSTSDKDPSRVGSWTTSDPIRELETVPDAAATADGVGEDEADPGLE